MSTKRILLMDDEYELSFVVATCLEEFGSWEVLRTQTAKEGLCLAQTKQPDAIVLDVMMPEMDGVTLFHCLKKEPTTQTIPVIFITAKVQTSDLNQYNKLGAKGIISKPFDPFKIVEQITKILH